MRTKLRRSLPIILFLSDDMEKILCSAAEFAANYECLLADGGCVPLCVTGASMNPFLVDGRDMVWLVSCKQADFRRGRIILFKRGDGSFVLHRIRKLLPDGSLMMNGDAQLWSECISREQAVAVVREIERNGKKLSCNSFSFRFAGFCWQAAKPLRPLLMRVWRRLRRK